MAIESQLITSVRLRVARRLSCYNNPVLIMLNICNTFSVPHGATLTTPNQSGQISEVNMVNPYARCAGGQRKARVPPSFPMG